MKEQAEMSIAVRQLRENWYRWEAKGTRGGKTTHSFTDNFDEAVNAAREDAQALMRLGISNVKEAASHSDDATPAITDSSETALKQDQSRVGFGQVRREDGTNVFSVYTLPSKEEIGSVRLTDRPLIGAPHGQCVYSWQFDSLLESNLGYREPVLTTGTPDAMKHAIKQCKANIAVRVAEHIGEFDIADRGEEQSSDHIDVYDSAALAYGWNVFQSISEPDQDTVKEITMHLPDGLDFKDAALYARSTGLVSDDAMTMLGLDGTLPPVKETHGRV